MNVDGYEQQCEDVHNMYDDGFVYNMDDFPPLASLSGKSKINFEKKLAGKRMIITGAIKKGGEEGHAGLITTKAAPQGPAIHAHKVRSEDADNHVLKNYVQNVYGSSLSTSIPTLPTNRNENSVNGKRIDYKDEKQLLMSSPCSGEFAMLSLQYCSALGGEEQQEKY